VYTLVNLANSEWNTSGAPPIQVGGTTVSQLCNPFQGPPSTSPSPPPASPTRETSHSSSRSAPLQTAPRLVPPLCSSQEPTLVLPHSPLGPFLGPVCVTFLVPSVPAFLWPDVGWIPTSWCGAGVCSYAGSKWHSVCQRPSGVLYRTRGGAGGDAPCGHHCCCAAKCLPQARGSGGLQIRRRPCKGTERGVLCLLPAA